MTPEIQQQIDAIVLPTGDARQQMLEQIIGLIDLTTLSGTDTEARVRQLCATALQPHLNVPTTAAVCVYPPFAAIAKEVLAGSNVRVAAVAGAFPSGQSFLPVRVAEVEATVAAGADEIDTVINRGAMLSGETQRVFDEIVAIKQACGGKTLKVILETGELASPEMIRDASQIAIEAGADFIKTSTGMAKVNATLEAAAIMLNAIKASGKPIGFKPAGGIRSAEQALQYATLVQQVLGDEWITAERFRFGASSLLGNVVAAWLGKENDGQTSDY